MFSQRPRYSRTMKMRPRTQSSAAIASQTPLSPRLPASRKERVIRTPHMVARLMKKGPLESPAPHRAPEATMDAPNSGSAKATMRRTWVPRATTSDSEVKIRIS